MAAILLSRNLLSSSRVAGAASACGLPLKTVRDLEQATPETLRETRLVLIDLDEFDPQPIVQRLQQLECAADVVAFGPHVDQHRLEAAQKAGCHQVLTHGQLAATISEILAGYA